MFISCFNFSGNIILHAIYLCFMQISRDFCKSRYFCSSAHIAHSFVPSVAIFQPAEVTHAVVKSVVHRTIRLKNPPNITLYLTLFWFESSELGKCYFLVSRGGFRHEAAHKVPPGIKRGCGWVGVGAGVVPMHSDVSNLPYKLLHFLPCPFSINLSSWIRL